MALPHRLARYSNNGSFDVTPKYDSKPLLSAPAVVERAKRSGGIVRPIRIPESVIPSPLAPNISPDQLVKLRTDLVGTAPERMILTGNGSEIWLSWKRAWDLWNNHYIHGRANPVWVRKEWERMEAERRRAIPLAGVFGQKPDVVMTNVTIEPDADGSSGGFKAIKDLPEFKAPPPRNSEEPDDGLVWDDLIDNTVWRPRRVGEKTLRVDLDSDLEKFLMNSDLERDRGVDCGRLPYPVLRRHLEYVEDKDGAFKKMKVWDGVTGTVFNMPTRPLDREPEDDKLIRVRQLFGNSYRDLKPASANKGIFPLDIRRIVRVVPAPLTQPVTSLLKENEVLMYDRQTAKEVPSFTYRDMSENDPWWVTKEQATLLDYPPRRFPLPEQKYNPELIPVDDTIWREEFDRDQMKETGYFVTNLYGGTLLINGMGVEKGDVAGPLPKFAVIECPGGQIAFWFGAGGRTHLAGWEKAPYAKWLALRQQKGWKYTGLSAGQVWNAKIKDRVERKKTGEDQSDDEEWDAWLKPAPVKPEKGPPSSVTYQVLLPGRSLEEPLPLPANVAQPHVMFPSELHELAWLTAQRERRLGKGRLNDVAILPAEEHFFPGSQDRLNFIKYTGINQEKVDAIWAVRARDARRKQQALIQGIRQKKDREARAEEERLRTYHLPATESEKKAEALRKKQELEQQKLEDAKRLEIQRQKDAEALRKEQELEKQRLEDAIRLEEQRWQDELDARNEAKRKFFEEREEAAKRQKLQDEQQRKLAEDLENKAAAERLLQLLNQTVDLFSAGPPQLDLQSYLQTLEDAYIAGSKARARLQRLSWEEYTQRDAGQTPAAYVKAKVLAANITAEQMPVRITPDMSAADVDIARQKWDRLRDIVMRANDFEAQTVAAGLKPDKLRLPNGKFCAEI